MDNVSAECTANEMTRILASDLKEDPKNVGEWVIAAYINKPDNTMVAVARFRSKTPNPYAVIMLTQHILTNAEESYGTEKDTSNGS